MPTYIAHIMDDPPVAGHKFFYDIEIEAPNLNEARWLAGKKLGDHEELRSVKRKTWRDEDRRG